ncbi:unnamed protein product [Lupinus luteus]|uniref:Uncharacterized protein n=1 Tax=Lupinus luteus TaxID=3873 RepID=A0AAV1W275_LUPLU
MSGWPKPFASSIARDSGECTFPFAYDDSKVGLVTEGAIYRLVPVLLDWEVVPDYCAVAATVLTSLAIVDTKEEE